MEKLTVQEASVLTGLSAHTLRYYERIGLLEPVARNASGHRRYERTDLEHLQFLHCLRASGMPIRRLKEFAALVQAGQPANDARLNHIPTELGFSQLLHFLGQNSFLIRSSSAINSDPKK